MRTKHEHRGGGNTPRRPPPTSTNFAEFPIDNLLRALREARGRIQGSGPSWMATCPAHCDLTPSLAISETSDGPLLVHCFGGCETDAVLAKLGLELCDLFPSREAAAAARRGPRGYLDY